MPRRVKADDSAILALVDAGINGREVARRLGIHENTVYAATKRRDGRCLFCGQPVALGKKHCPTHLAEASERQRRKRKERKRLGKCAECDSPIEPPSVLYCATHREATFLARERAALAKRGAPKQGVPSETQRLKAIRLKFGEGGVIAWQRDGARCVICGVHHREKSVHLHHIDLTTGKTEAENLACLCFVCHQLVHRLIEHSDPRGVLGWIRATYPALSLD